MGPQFVLSEAEFTDIEDCLSQVQMVRNLTSVVERNPRLDAPVTRTQLVAFLGSIENTLGRAVNAVNERQAAESVLGLAMPMEAQERASSPPSDPDAEIELIAEVFERQALVAREVLKARACGALPADRASDGLAIGLGDLAVFKAWLGGADVEGFAKLHRIGDSKCRRGGARVAGRGREM